MVRRVVESRTAHPSAGDEDRDDDRELEDDGDERSRIAAARREASPSRPNRTN